MCNIRGPEKPSRATRTSSGKGLQRSRSPCGYKRFGVRPKRLKNKPARQSADRSNRAWAPPTQRGATSSGHHHGFPFDEFGRTRPQGRQPGSPALRAARQAKERTYPELVGGTRCRLVVLAMEVGGKWSKEAADFLRLLAQARNRSVVPALRKAAVQASIARWSAMLTMAAQAPFAASLILQNPASHTTPDGDMPPLSTLLEHHPGAPPPASRLPLRP